MCSAFRRAFAFSSEYLHLIVFCRSQNCFISICVLHSVLCVRICYVDISDCQMSGVGLGIIKSGQDYKALTVLYWSPPLSFVKRGTSSAEALEVMSKNRTAVYPPFPPCPGLLHLVLFAPHIFLVLLQNPLCCLCLSVVRYLLSPFTFCRSLLCLSFCLSSIPFFLLDLSVHMVIKKLFCFCFFKRNVLGIKRLVPL